MKILGVDPGINTAGFGIIIKHGMQFQYVTSGCIRTQGELVGKIAIIFNGLREIISDHTPDVIVLERAFMRPDRPNPDAAIKLGHARGAIIAAACMYDVPVVEYSPNQIKKVIVGKGHASKNQLGYMVTEILKLSSTPQTDAADALAGALCHGYHL